VLRDGGAADAEVGGDVSGGHAGFGEHIEDAAAGRIADGGEDVVTALAGGGGHCGVIMCKVMLTCQER